MEKPQLKLLLALITQVEKDMSTPEGDLLIGAIYWKASEIEAVKKALKLDLEK